jgi:hypothetical protein
MSEKKSPADSSRYMGFSLLPYATSGTKGMSMEYPLAVGEPCAGSFDGDGFYCRCKATHPRDCITETAMTTDSCVRTLPKSVFENW